MKKIITLFLTLFLSSTIFAAPIKEFVVIGDSLSDNGNLYDALFKIVPKSPPYFKGRFSNGPTWAEDVGKFYYDKYNVNYRVIAYGGATAILHNPKNDKFVAPITLDGEMAKYYMQSLFTDKSKVLFALWIGANDYLYDEQPDINKLVNDVVNKIAASAGSLVKQGAQTIVVMNLPDLARTPFAKNHGTGARLHALSILHNQKLDEAVTSLRAANPNVKFITINIFDIFNNLLDNTAAFNQMYHVNLTNTYEACWKGGMTLKNSTSNLHAELQKAVVEKGDNFDTQAVENFIMNSPSLAVAYNNSKAYEDGLKPCDNASEHLFWDELHPSEVVHGILSKIFVSTMENEKTMM